MYKIAIPSYNRPEILKEKTLYVLFYHQINPELVSIFVANEEEKEKYSKILEPGTYKDIIVGEKGIVQIRNFIQQYYKEDEHVVMLDDDLEQVLELSQKHLVPIHNLDALFKEGFELCRQYDYHLWGIAPVANSFFLKRAHSTDLKFCIGHMCGIINRKQIIPAICAPKEDYWRTLDNAMRDGGVIRFNHVCAKTKMYSVGGIGNKKSRIEANEEAVKYLLNRYNGIVRRNKKREGEILLARNIKNYRGDYVFEKNLRGVNIS